MLANEKYTGDVIFQKTYTDSQFNRHVNRGEKDRYALADHHEAIISREDLDAVRALIQQRGREKGIDKGSGKYQNRYCFSGKIICGECGGSFKRRIHSCSGNKYAAWCCNTHINDKNNGTVPQYYVEGDHEAIIPKDIFLLVQEELARRRLVHTTENGKRRCYSCNHCFAQMVFCGECGEFFRRVHWNNRGCKSIVWRCVGRLENTGHVCRARTVNEEYLQEVVVQAINQVLCKKDDFLKALQTNIATVIKQGDTLSPEVIDERLRELQKELLKKANQKDDYDAIADEIRLRDMRKQAEVDSVVRDEQMRLIRDLQDFIRQQPTTITGFDETLVKRLITKISVFEDHFTIDFKSGVTIDIKA